MEEKNLYTLNVPIWVVLCLLYINQTILRMDIWGLVDHGVAAVIIME